jgi:hypothetical protein
MFERGDLVRIIATNDPYYNCIGKIQSIDFIYYDELSMDYDMLCSVELVDHNLSCAYYAYCLDRIKVKITEEMEEIVELWSQDNSVR